MQLWIIRSASRVPSGRPVAGAVVIAQDERQARVAVAAAQLSVHDVEWGIAERHHVEESAKPRVIVFGGNG